MPCYELYICITISILGFSSSQQHSPISEDSVINRTKQDGQTLSTSDYHFRYAEYIAIYIYIYIYIIAVLDVF